MCSTLRHSWKFYVMFSYLFIIAEHRLENAAVEIAIFKELMWPSVLLCRVETSCDVDPGFPKFMASQADRWMGQCVSSWNVSQAQAFTLIAGFQNDAMMKDAPKAVKPSAMIRRHPSGRCACLKAWLIIAPKNAWAAQFDSPSESSCNDSCLNHGLASPRWIVSQCMCKHRFWRLPQRRV